MLFRWVNIIILLFFWNTSFAMELNVSKEKNFISIADIHFDPLQGCAKQPFPCSLIQELNASDSKAWGSILEKYKNNIKTTYRENTNYVLLKSTLNELKDVSYEVSPSFVLILGDFLAHDYRKYYKKYSGDKSRDGYMAFVKKTMEYLTYELNQTFPTIDIYPVVGNNDSYTGDYNIVPRGVFLRDLTLIWSSFIKNKNNKQRFLTEFPDGGYYSVNIGLNSRVIILNSVLFSPYSQNAAVKEMAWQQLLWLKKELRDAKQKSDYAFIALHIPGATDLNVSMLASYQIFKRFWKNDYSKNMTATIKEFSDTITAVFPGHVHIDMFPFFISINNGKNIPMLITPSVSPIYGNNPAIKVFYYDQAQLRLDHFDRYYLAMDTSPSDWRKGNRFNSIYYADCHYCYLVHIFQHLTSNNDLFNLFQKYYSGVDDGRSNENDWMAYYWCSVYNSDIKSYKECLTH